MVMAEDFGYLGLLFLLLWLRLEVPLHGLQQAGTSHGVQSNAPQHEYGAAELVLGQQQLDGLRHRHHTHRCSGHR